MNIEPGMRVSFQIFDVRIAKINTLTGTVLRQSSKGINPLYTISEDEPGARNRAIKLKLRATQLTVI